MSIPKIEPSLSTGARTGRRTGKTSHYFDSATAVESHPRKVHLHVGGLAAERRAWRGGFGARATDRGTLVLLREPPPPPPRGEILDLGSGYGPIAIALARQAPDA